MPMYDYRCKSCDKVFEELVSSSATSDEKIECPQCSQNKSKRLLSAPMISTNSSSNCLSKSSSSECGHSGFS